LSDLSATKGPASATLQTQLDAAELRARGLERMLGEVQVITLRQNSERVWKGDNWGPVTFLVGRLSDSKAAQARVYAIDGVIPGVERERLLAQLGKDSKCSGATYFTSNAAFSVYCFAVDSNDANDDGQLLGSFRSGGRIFRLVAAAWADDAPKRGDQLTLIAVPEPRPPAAAK
jgi:hypothetical protein